MRRNQDDGRHLCRVKDCLNLCCREGIGENGGFINPAAEKSSVAARVTPGAYGPRRIHLQSSADNRTRVGTGNQLVIAIQSPIGAVVSPGQENPIADVGCRAARRRGGAFASPIPGSNFVHPTVDPHLHLRVERVGLITVR